MKKMVCEICESQKIKKENGVFICQDCGTEYSLEEAKSLLIEICEDNFLRSVKNEENENKYSLLHKILSWYEVVSCFEEINIWLNIDKNFLCSEEKYEETKKYIKSLENNNEIKLNDYYLKNASELYLNGDEMPYWMTREEKDFVIKNREPLKVLYGYYPEIAFFKDAEINRLIQLIDKQECHVYVFKSSIKPDRKSCDFFLTGSLIGIDKPRNMSRTLSICDNFNSSYKTYVNIPNWLGNPVYHECGAIYFHKYMNRVEEIKKCLINRHKQLMECINDNFTTMKLYYLQLIESIDELEKHLNIPYKYRNITDLIKLIEYLKNGRCDTWKEAINMLENEKFQNTIIKSIDEMKNIIIEVGYIIKVEINNINNALLKINKNLTSLNQSVNLCQFALNNIMFDTRYQLISDIFK